MWAPKEKMFRPEENSLTFFPCENSKFTHSFAIHYRDTVIRADRWSTFRGTSIGLIHRDTTYVTPLLHIKTQVCPVVTWLS